MKLFIFVERALLSYYFSFFYLIVQQQVFYYKDIESIQFRNRSVLNFLAHNDQDMTIFLKNGKNEWIVLNYYVYFLSKRMILKAFKTFKKKELIPQ